MASSATRTLLGLGILEFVFSLEERLIQTQEYYDNSLLMVLNN